MNQVIDNKIEFFENVAKNIQPISLVKKENHILLNYKKRRKIASVMTKQIMKSTEFYNFCSEKRKEIDKLIRNTLKAMNEVNKKANEYTIYIDLTDSSNEQLFKHFDNPNVELEETDSSFYLVRPEEQTAPQRQTQVYQLEQLLDILKGATKPKVTFVVKTDREYENKIYVYDGQHRLLLVFNLIYQGNSFSIKALKRAFEKKREYFLNENEWPDEWKALQEFMDKFDGTEFDYQDLLNVIPEIEETFTDPEIMQVKGDFHICDSKTASLLFKKLNEQVSGHSTAQRVKADLVGTIFNDLLFKSKLKISKNMEGYLSELIPQIGLFNLGLGENKTTSPKTFGYNLSSIDTQEDMNMDQFLLYVYAMMLTKIRKVGVLETSSDGDELIQNQVYKFDKNVRLRESEFNATGQVQTSNAAWSSRIINDKVKAFWLERFSNLQIDDEEEFIEFLRDIIEMAVIVNTQEFSSAANRWYDKLKTKMKPFSDRIAEIEKDYPGENWKNTSDFVPDDVKGEMINLNFAVDCVEQYKLGNRDQFAVLLSFALSSRPSKFKLHDWMVGFFETMIMNFQNDWDEFETEKRTKKLSNPRGTYKRIGFQSEDYCHTGIFKKQVSDYLEAVDTSLWKRTYAVQKYIREILEHYDDQLYKCPHTCEWVTIDDFHSHHLHFRSEGDANKLFKYWCPLSPKFNNQISDNHERNIVDVDTDGNFLNACDTLIEMMEIKKNSTSDKKEKADWKKSVRVIESWKDRAEIYFEENNQ